ncbi:hypothetical protein J5N97_000481 [Dioscorea zingiberensis]|uniref:Uncharacterized protein n=1 Tax=Dioscorea zingiberensis TaxID=325984 RepID=A0A9D5BSG9_9LILI|nr:hypothetical protein J5N97_000481 [Dioscorea zingiberensis]
MERKHTAKLIKLEVKDCQGLLIGFRFDQEEEQGDEEKEGDCGEMGEEFAAKESEQEERKKVREVGILKKNPKILEEQIHKLNKQIMAAKTGKTNIMRLLRDDNTEDQDTQRQAERIDMDTHFLRLYQESGNKVVKEKSRRLKEASQPMLIEQNQSLCSSDQNVNIFGYRDSIQITNDQGDSAMIVNEALFPYQNSNIDNTTSMASQPMLIEQNRSLCSSDQNVNIFDYRDRQITNDQGHSAMIVNEALFPHQNSNTCDYEFKYKLRVKTCESV